MFWEFVRLLRPKWMEAISGGGAALVGIVWLLVSQRESPEWAQVTPIWVIIVGLVVAIFPAVYRAWRDEREKVKRLELEIANIKPTWSDSMTPVIGKTFTKEEIVIDGKSFHRCTFIDVTFTFKGIGGFEFGSDCKLGNYQVRTFNNPAKVFAAFVVLLRELLPSSMHMGEINLESGETRHITDVTPSQKPQK